MLFPRMRTLSLVASLSVPLAASAQNEVPAPPPAPAAPPRVEVVQPTDPAASWIEEIVITAQGREQLAQDFGGSIVALSGAALDAQNIQEVHDLQFQIPSFVATSAFAQVTVRGIGRDVVAPSSDSGFGVHVDGVPLIAEGGQLDYFDIERIEVLPGPQGTQGGRHSPGGSIYIYTNRPAPEWYFSGDAEVASYGKFRARTVLNVPLGETLAARVAAIWERPAYPLKGEPSGQRYAMNYLDGGTMARASLRWTPTETLTVDLIGSGVYNNSHGGQWRYLGEYPTYQAGQSPLFWNTTIDYAGATPNPSSALDFRQNRANEDQRNWVWSAQLNAEWELGPVLARSTSHYVESSYNSDFDRDSSDLDAERAIFEVWLDTLTQELSFASNTDGRLQWRFGGIWQSERPQRWRYREWNYQRNAAAANFVILDVFTFAPFSGCAPSGGAACFFSALPDDFLWLELRASVRTDTAGAYASASFDLTERLRVSGGVRYNRVERNLRDTSFANIFNESLDQVGDNFCGDVIGSPLPAATCFDLLLTQPTGGLLTPTNTAFWIPIRGDRIIFSGNAEPIRLAKSWESVTGSARVEYTPLEDVLLYASFASGSRAGGFNLVEGWEGHTGFGPETNFAYELGAKTTLRDRLLLNVAAYWYDYRNKFTTGIVRGFTLTTNSGQADVYGAELQFAWATGDALRLRGSVGWLTAEYASDFFAADAAPGPDDPTLFQPSGEPGRRHGGARAPVNLNGNRLARAPEWTLALGADYRFELGDHGSLTARLDFAWRDEVHHRQFENPLDRQRAFTRTDLSLRWDRGDEGGWAELYVNNLEDRRKVKSSLYSEDQHRQWFLAPPRMVGFRAGWTWRSEESPLARLRGAGASH